MSTDDITGVLADLDTVIEQASAEASPRGYFAAVYRNVTAAVRDGLEAGLFDVPERTERLDVVFAGRYLDAVRAHVRGRPPTHSWQVSLEAAGRWRPIILQHLLTGINAHINLDLGIAAATVAPGDELPTLRRDFDRINEILGAQLDIVQAALGRVSPWMGLVDVLGGRSDERIFRFSLERARASAWAFASELAGLPQDAWSGPIRVRDRITASLGRAVLRPGLLQPPLLVVRAREGGDVAATIRVLAGLPDPSVEEVRRRLGDPEPPAES